MKKLLTVLLLFIAWTAKAQPSYHGPETPQPVKWQSAVVAHGADSARVAYGKVLRGLLAAGYAIDKTDKEVLFVSTPPKSIDGKVFLTLNISVAPVLGGSEVVFQGVYTWLNATTIMAHLENRQLPAQYINSGGSNPTQRAWDEMQRVTLTCLPATRLSYR